MLEILPSVAATVIGGYLLTQLHFGHSTPPSAQPAAATASTQEPGQEPTVGEDRAAMSEVLKQRREKPEQPAQVKAEMRAAATPAPTSVAAASPARPAATASIPVGMDSISPHEPVARPAPSRPAATPATPTPAAAPRPDAESEVYVPAPPPGLPSAPPRGMDAPTVIVPSVASAAPPAPAAAPPAVAPNTPPAETPPAAAPSPPDRQGPVGVVLSTFSNFVGHAANATGHTVNWVIDLPGKAISAGGRAIGVSPPPPPSRPFS